MTTERRSIRNQIPTIVSLLVMISMFFGAMVLFSSSLNNIENNTKEIQKLTAEYKENDERLDDNDVQHGILETKLDNIITVLEEIKDGLK